MEIKHQLSSQENTTFYAPFRLPQHKMLDGILGTKQTKNKEKDKKIKCSSVFSILKGAPQVDPASLNPSQERDFSALKAAVMLMGLPIGQIDDYMLSLIHI